MREGLWVSVKQCFAFLERGRFGDAGFHDAGDSKGVRGHEKGGAGVHRRKGETQRLRRESREWRWGKSARLSHRHKSKGVKEDETKEASGSVGRKTEGRPRGKKKEGGKEQRKATPCL